MSDPSRTILLVRHGETEWSANRRHTGRTDLPLTPAGEQEARDAGVVLSRLLAGGPVAAVYASPLQRAQHTAALALADPPAPLQTSELVIEWDYGEYDGLRTSEIRQAQPTWELWRDGCPGGESPGDVMIRAHRFVSDVSALGPGAVVVFTHGHLSRALTAAFLGFGPSLAAALRNDTASIAEIRAREGDLALVGWNLRLASSARHDA